MASRNKMPYSALDSSSNDKMSGGGLYTSFDDPPAKKLAGSKAGESSIPRGPGVSMTDLVVNRNGVECFFGRDHVLSNFYVAPFVLNGNTYNTIEHYYEACKIRVLLGPEQARSLKTIKEAGPVKSASRRMLAAARIPKSFQDKWRQNDGILVVKVAVIEKFRQNKKLCEALLKTGSKLLAQCNRADDLWAVGMDGNQFKDWVDKHDGETITVPSEVSPETVQYFPRVGRGKNLLGFLIMNVRDMLRREQHSLGNDVQMVDVGRSGASAFPTLMGVNAAQVPQAWQ